MFLLKFQFKEKHEIDKNVIQKYFDKVFKSIKIVLET